MLIFVATALFDFAVGLFAIYKRNNPATLALMLLTFSLGLWQIELFLLSAIRDDGLIDTFFHITRAGMFFTPAFMSLLAWQICGAGSRRFKNLVLIPGFTLSAALSLSNIFLFPSTLVHSEGGWLPKIDAVYYVFACTFVYTLTASLRLAFVSHKRVPQREKRRIKWLLISLLLILSLGVLALVLVGGGDAYLSKLVGAVSNGIFVGVLLYATINHHLTDVSSAFSSLLARFAVTAVLVVAFLAFSEYIRDVLPSPTNLLIPALVMAAVLEIYPRLLRAVLPGTRRLLVNGGYDVDLTRKEIQLALKRCVSTDDLLEVLRHLLCDTMHASAFEVGLVCQGSGGNQSGVSISCLQSGDGLADSPQDETLAQLRQTRGSFVMFDEATDDLRRIMARREAIACLPLIHNESLIGIVLIGRLKSYQQNYFRQDDIRMLEWLARELPPTLSRTVLHTALKSNLDKAEKTMSMIELMNQYHHDIKAPLSIIDGVVSNNLYDKEKQHRIILEQVHRGTELISMMSAVLRGQRERQTEPVNLEQIIRNCVMLFEREISHSELDFAPMSDVVGDPNDLKILFINLIKNAVEAKCAGQELKLTVSGGETGEQVWVRVCDNGCGFSEERLSAIWSGQQISSKPKGSGVGLRAIKRIVDEHGGAINVRSREGEGACFELSFPMRIQFNERVPENINLQGFE
ncbi:HAMP domain-containing sensor histidine kinase [Granulosicoccaceae sp. 1_MG-2023]|nr:HAMP domain-containing sensor histidine kinase [Granulosicoccaceae sp. 1_MG-2023]